MYHPIKYKQIINYLEHAFSLTLRNLGLFWFVAKGWLIPNFNYAPMPESFSNCLLCPMEFGEILRIPSISVLNAASCQALPVFIYVTSCQALLEQSGQGSSDCAELLDELAVVPG